ncbi:hypothetical protein ACSSZE_11195 [Acidithiobacillus caldus]
MDLMQHIQAEQQWIARLRDDIPGIAVALTETILNRLEKEIEEQTRGGWLADTADVLRRLLSLELSDAFEAGIEREVLALLRTRESPLKLLLGRNWEFNSDRQALNGLRKSIRLLPLLQYRIERMLQRAKPGALTQLFRAITNEVDDIEGEWEKDGAALRAAFEAERSEIEALITQAASELLRQLCAQYRRALDIAE